MGLADRDYYRRPPPSSAFGQFRNWSITSWLIAINIAVFIVDNVSNHLLLGWGEFTVDTAIHGFQFWRFITCQFLHRGVQHIFQNMIALYFVGPSVEQVLRSRRYLSFYLVCGIAGPLMCMLFAAIQFLAFDAQTSLIGASAGIMGVLVATAVINPNMRIMFDFIIPMTMRTMALLLLGLAVVTIVFGGQNAGGEAAHIGGAVAGYLLIRYPRLLDWANYRPGPRMRYRP